jgi:hypothetical protein
MATNQTHVSQVIVQMMEEFDSGVEQVSERDHPVEVWRQARSL